MSKLAQPITGAEPMYLSPQALAQRWGTSVASLASLRNRRSGIPYYVFGKLTVRYKIEDVLAYESSGRKVETHNGA